LHERLEPVGIGTPHEKRQHVRNHQHHGHRRVRFHALRAHAAPPFEIGDADAYARVVAAAFAQRRKTLRNSLGGLLTQAQIAAAGVDPAARPETLSPAQFAALARELAALGACDWSARGGDL